MRTIRAIFREGHIEPLEPVDLPENTPLTVAVGDTDDLNAAALAQLVKAGGSFDFLDSAAEEIYDTTDGEAL